MSSNSAGTLKGNVNEVFVQPPIGYRWKVGSIHKLSRVDDEWIRRNTEIDPCDVENIFWYDKPVDAWVIKLKNNRAVR
jgi:hypothetical protein